MAPKRGRVSTGFTASKKQAKADAEVPRLCSAVAKSLDAATGLPESVVKMLAAAVPSSLALLKEERHAFQEQSVGMVGEALAAKGASLDKAKEEAAAKLAEVSAEKEKLAAAITEAEQGAEQLSAAVADAKAKVEESGVALKAAKEAAKAAVDDEKSYGAELHANEEAKAEIECVQTNALQPLVEGTADVHTKDVTSRFTKAVVKAAKAYLELDVGLLESIPATLGKGKGERGTFDGLVLKLLQGAVDTALAGLNEKLAAGEGGKESRTAAVASTQQAVDTAKSALEASEKVLAEAKEAETSGDARVKEAKTAAKQQEAGAKKAQKENDAAESASTEFKEGPLQAFAELKDREPLPPPPVAEAEAEPAAEAAAPEAPAAPAEAA